LLHGRRILEARIFALQCLVDVAHLVLLRILGHNLRVVLRFVQLVDDFFSLFVARSAKLSDIPGK
jgi:hypothetical protein